MKIALVTPFYYPAIQYGGPVTLLKNLAASMERAGHRVHVLSTDLGIENRQPVGEWVAVDGYRVWYGRTRWYNRCAPYFEPMLERPLRDILRECDLVHAHIGLTLLNRMVFAIAKKAKKPFVYSAHGALCPVRINRLDDFKTPIKKAFLEVIEKPLLQNVDAAIATSEKESRDLISHGCPQNRVHVLRNAIHPVDPPARPPRLFRRRFGFKPDVPLVLFLGRIAKHKGLDLLLAAVAAAQRNHQVPVQLAVSGPPGDFSMAAHAMVRDLGIGGRVAFTGVLDGDIKEAAFWESDLFALTSYSEGLPMAVLEACCRGLPVLITDECNVPEVREYRAGIITEPRIEDVARALQQMLTLGPDRTQMGERARQMVRDRYSMVDLTSRYIAICESIIDGRH